MIHIEECGASVLGLDVDWPRVKEARRHELPVTAATAERLPLRSASLGFVLLNEVLEHVADDRAALTEVARVLCPGGHAAIFVPNRWWPFETHGVIWRGRYLFGNAPLINYLPDPIRNTLAPHVRVYTAEGLSALVAGLPLEMIVLTQVFPGYDKLAYRRPTVGRTARRLSYFLETTPLRLLGLSHLLIVKRAP
jgi:SAM-dependent methyltransferase